MIEREAIMRAARRCIGVRFRPQGRDPAQGLDCVGLVAVAFGSRLRGPVPNSYAQRGGGTDSMIADAVERAGLMSISVSASATGDLLLLRTGPAQWHFAILTNEGFIHADARLRRVVEVPAAPPWPVVRAWRSIEGEG